MITGFWRLCYCLLLNLSDIIFYNEKHWIFSDLANNRHWVTLVFSVEPRRTGPALPSCEYWTWTCQIMFSLILLHHFILADALLYTSAYNAECILYNNATDCNERRFKALHNGGQVSNLENMWWHLEVESISVRKGCRLTVFTGDWIKFTP